MTPIPRDAPPSGAHEDHASSGEVYRLSRGAAWTAWLAAAACVLSLVACFAVPIYRPGSFVTLYLAFAGTVALAPIAAAVLSGALRAHDRFGVAQHGLIRRGLLGRGSLLPWEDVESVIDRPSLQRVDVVDRTGSRISLSYRIADFERLAQSIATRTGPGNGTGSDAPEPMTAFVRAGYGLIPLPVLALVVLAASRVLFGGVLIAAWVIAIGFWLSWLWGWRRVRIADGEVVVHYPLLRRRIGGVQIRRVEVEMERNGFWRRPAVVIHLPARRRVRLAGSREGHLALYGAIHRLALQARPEEVR